jgi:hypothetical protein
MAAETRPAGQPVDSQDLARSPLRGRIRMLAVWLLAVAATGVGLRLADALPRLALGVPRGVVRAPDVPQLERASGRRMPVPAYFPDTIEWPPEEARMHTSGSAAVWCRLRTGRGIALIVATAPPGTPDIAAAVLPASVELQREAGSLGSRPAVVSRVRDAEGTLWHQVQWQLQGQIILVRYRGTLDELLKIAGSVHD